jgi:hypothetical protein
MPTGTLFFEESVSEDDIAALEQDDDWGIQYKPSDTPPIGIYNGHGFTIYLSAGENHVPAQLDWNFLFDVDLKELEHLTSQAQLAVSDTSLTLDTVESVKFKPGDTLYVEQTEKQPVDEDGIFTIEEDEFTFSAVYEETTQDPLIASILLAETENITTVEDTRHVYDSLTALIPERFTIAKTF